jgi:hypothetical protein
MAQLQTKASRTVYVPKKVTGDWQEHSVTMRHLEPRQRIDITAERVVSVARLADLLGGGRAELLGQSCSLSRLVQDLTTERSLVVM